MRITALAGGVGAAKFLRGLIRAIDPAKVTIIGNTGDDAIFHGLHVSPDLDIVTYTLAGLVDERMGWGIAGDTTTALDQMSSLGIDTWFRLGDKDLGTHLARTTWLNQGEPLSVVTDRIRTAFGVGARIIPMSDDPVRTKLRTVNGDVLDFQEYFVRRRHADEISEIAFDGVAAARPAPGVIEAIEEGDRVIICPSNPVISIGPILAVPGVRGALVRRKRDVFAVSPIVQGSALKGPADKLLPTAGAEVSAYGVATLYREICGAFVIDHRDAVESQRIEGLGMKVLARETIMETPAVSEQLAKEILAA
jgi:LPPG:FO 2-phospho-L-lactate transferase